VNASGIGAPVALAAGHDVSGFSCGVPELDTWLKLRALENPRTGVSRTFVICGERRVIGYYSLASAEIQRSIATPKLRRNMPDKISAALIGRLAVDVQFHGKGLGTDLVYDAIRHIASAAEHVGVRAILIHAISDEAAIFYEKVGFDRSPIESRTLMMTVADAVAALESATRR
jgi:predicted N-acetyltransferase YhbS